MAEWKKVKIDSFLKERENRIKPEEANKMGLKRLNKIDFSGEIYLVNKPTNTNMILIKKGDLVISGINVEKGALAVYQGNEDILATIHYSAYIFDETKIDIKYFKTFLKSKAFRDVINSQIRSGIKTELKASKFLPLEINLPDLETQIEIRNKINLASERIFEIFNINNSNESYISKLCQVILQSAVQGKLVPQNPNDEPASELLKKIKAVKNKLIKEGKIKKQKPLPPISKNEIPYELPKRWKWVRLRDVLEFGSSRKIESKKIFSNIWILDLEDIEKTTSRLLIKKRFQDSPSKSTKNIFSKGDVLYGKLRPYLDKVVIADEDGVCTTEILPLKTFNNLIYNGYLRYFLKNPMFLSRVNSLTYGIKMPRLGTKDLMITLFPLPPLSEQKRIVEKVDKLMVYCEELEKQVKENLENAEKLMEAVLKESFENY